MPDDNLSKNGLNEVGTSSEGLSPGRCPVDEQDGPGRDHATATTHQRRGGKNDWSKLNGTAIECYIQSEQERRGYMDRMIKIWVEKGLFEVTKQRPLVIKYSKSRKKIG